MSAVGGSVSLNPEPGSSRGYCRKCGHYGQGRFDDIRTALTDWIRDHVGCPRPPDDLAEQGSDE